MILDSSAPVAVVLAEPGAEQLLATPVAFLLARAERG
jgi:hypothetical protein